MSDGTHDKIRAIPVKPAEPRYDERPGFDQLRELLPRMLDVLRRRWRLFFATAGGLFALVSVAILAQTPIYESTAQMIFKFGRELVYQPEIGSDATLVPRDKQALINSELAILRSRPVVEGVVGEIGLETLYPDLAEAWGAPGVDVAGSDLQDLVVAEAAERLLGTLEAQALPETDVLQVSFQHPEPIVARATVSALIEQFLEAHVNAFAEPEIAEFLTQRVADYERRLAESEATLREFQTAHPAFAQNEPQIVLLQERDRLRAKADELDAQVAAIRLSHLQGDTAVSEAKSRLLHLRVEESQLKGEQKAGAREQMRVVENFIVRRKGELDRELRPLIAKRDELLAKLERFEAELAELPALSAEYRSLARERDADEEQYRTYVKRLRDARLSGEMDSEKITSVNLIQPASVSPRPIWPPRKAISVPLAAGLSFVVALLVLALVERLGPGAPAEAAVEPERRAREAGASS